MPIFKKILIVSVMALIPVFVKGLSPMDLPSCFVKGEILDVNFQEDVRHLESGFSLVYPDRFALDIFVDEVELVGEWEYDFYNCDVLYPVNEVVEIYIELEDVSDKDDLQEGNFIEGTVLNFFGPYFESVSTYQGEIKEKQIDSTLKPALVVIGTIFILLIIIFFLIRRVKKNH